MSKSLIKFVKSLMPTMICLVLVLAGIMPFSLLPFYTVPLPLVLVVIYYFAVFHPSALNCISVFFIGVFADLLTDSPFGLQAFSYVLLFFLANLNRRFLLSLNFAGLWTAFGVILAGTYLLWYLLFSLATLSWLNSDSLVFQYMTLVLIYPIISWVCGWFNMKIFGDTR